MQKRIFASYSIAPRAFSVYNLRGYGVVFITDIFGRFHIANEYDKSGKTHSVPV